MPTPASGCDFVEAFVFFIIDAVTVTVGYGTTVIFSDTFLIGAFVFFVGDAISVCIGTAIEPG